ncbi:MAG TPA: tRNA lysidine(34) synthetase TilS C-terminal domain-containing protein, partial [Thermoanaerobaculia bacterium]|nr:tRNA lysidine(34) synthetase TilS C-terminal domain-containing protein [Thermoanaerobaculia bacterium]
QPARGRLRKVVDLLREARIPRDQRRNLAVLCDASGILIWVEGLREGEASCGPSAKNSPVSFGIHPEMDGDSAGFRVVRRGDPASATMATGVPDEEP